MSASKQAKEAGLKSLLHVSEITGVRTSTLNNWYNHKPKLFKVVINGCKYSGIGYIKTVSLDIKKQITEATDNE